MNRKLIKRKVVLCDDILNIILCNLTIKDLLRLETVSEQFRDCVDYALKKKTGIRLGTKVDDCICLDSKHSIVGTNIRRSVEFNYNKYDLTYDLVKSRQSFETLLFKCSNIKSLYLSECRINLNVIQMIATRCPQLNCLSLVRIYCTSDLNKWKRMAECLSSLRLTHLAIAGDCYEEQTIRNCSKIQDFSQQIKHLIQQLSSLLKLTLLYYSKPLNSLFDCLPATIQSLNLIRCQKIDIHSMSYLTSNTFPSLTQIKLDLNFYGYRQETAILQLISNNLKLKKLVYFCDSLPEDELLRQFKNLETVKTLKLKIYNNSFFDLHFNPYPMLSLRSLFVQNFKVKPTVFDTFGQRFPNLRQLTLKNYQMVCVCTDDYSDGESYLIFSQYRVDCKECCSESMNYLSQIPQLKRLRLFGGEMQSLAALYHLKELSVLDLTTTWPNNLVAKSLVNTCAFISQHRLSKIPFSLMTNNSLNEELLKAMETTLNPIPSNLRLIISFYRKKRF